jgi:threonine dehydrogenase-like Zn-dependent dehydrogenase
VGLLAIIVARQLGVKNLFAIDSNPTRLQTAETHGATPLNLLTSPQNFIFNATENRGADIVIEAVGHADALRLAYTRLVCNVDNSFDILRPFGHIVSVGVQQDPLPFTGPECYAKNLRVQWGRCPVRGVFHDALEMLLVVQDELVDFVQVWPGGLEDAPKAFELFDKGEVGKVAFRMT